MAEVALLLVAVAAIWTPVVAVDVHGYRKFCSSAWATGLAPPPELAWCTASAFPSLYGHVQRKYWGVGPFRYWQLRQIPNFALAAPVVLIAVHAASTLWRRWRGDPPTTVANQFMTAEASVLRAGVAPFVGSWMFLTAYSVVVVNVQVTTRLVFASCPAIYWYLAAVTMAPAAGSSAIRPTWFVEAVAVYIVRAPLLRASALLPLTRCERAPGLVCIGRSFGSSPGWRFSIPLVHSIPLLQAGYNLLGPVLHANFLPWT